MILSLSRSLPHWLRLRARILSFFSRFSPSGISCRPWHRSNTRLVALHRRRGTSLPTGIAPSRQYLLQHLSISRCGRSHRTLNIGHCMSDRRRSILPEWTDLFCWLVRSDQWSLGTKLRSRARRIWSRWLWRWLQEPNGSRVSYIVLCIGWSFQCRGRGLRWREQSLLNLKQSCISPLFIRLQDLTQVLCWRAGTRTLCSGRSPHTLSSSWLLVGSRSEVCYSASVIISQRRNYIQVGRAALELRYVLALVYIRRSDYPVSGSWIGDLLSTHY